VIELRSYLS